MPIVIDPKSYPAQELLNAAEAGTLKELPALDYLTKVQKQCAATNNSEFLHLPVVYLYRLHYPHFSSEEQAMLDEIAATLCQHARPVRTARHFDDPVGYLQALVILRLLAGEEIAQDFEDAAREWLSHGWGGGAQLTHTGELRDGLAALLLLDDTPPPLTERLFAGLVRLEEALVEEPLPRFRLQGRCLRQCLDNEDNAGYFAALRRLGLRDKLPPPTAPEPFLTVPCSGGAVFQRNQSAAGILQTVSHTLLLPERPSSLRHLGPLYRRYGNGDTGSFNDRGLPWRTYTLQNGHMALALRLLTCMSPEPTELKDTWDDGPPRPKGVYPHCLSHSATTTARGGRIAVEAQGQAPNHFVVLWAVVLEGEIEGVPTVTPAQVIPSVPRQRGEEAWDIDWELPGGLWRVRVDPLAKEPLQIIRVTNQ